MHSPIGQPETPSDALYCLGKVGQLRPLKSDSAPSPPVSFLRRSTDWSKANVLSIESLR